MSKELDPLKFVDEIFEQEKSDAAMRERDPGGKWGPGFAYGAPKDGKVNRLFLTFMPSVSAWERESIALHERQAKEAAEFSAEREESIRLQKASAKSEEIEIGAGADAGNPTSKKESRSGHHEFDLVVI